MSQSGLRDFQITAVAARCMCGKATVRRYFKEPDRMKPIVRARVEKALREMGFLPATSGQ